jgi:cytochrome b561
MAILAHVLIYGLVLAVCVTGYLSSAHTRWDTVWWWAIEFPRIAPPNEELNEFWGELHMWTAWALLGIIAVHVSGAIYHAFLNDGIVRRMLRW